LKYSLLFPATIGLADGIITALVLVTGSILSGAGLSPGLSERVAFGSAFVGTFSFFIAEYSRLRGEINKTSRQLNLSSPRLLLKGKIGRDIFLEAIIGTSLSGVCGFLGAGIPLFINYLFPTHGYLSIISAILAMGALGAGIGRSVSGRYILWIVTMLILATLIAIVGNYLRIVP
jgi:VIT1/CCC1 family predicted Fe2+/Mn2+ transporter